jgi:HSP20 family protein
MTMMHWEPFRALRDLDRLSSEMASGTRTPMAMPMDVWRDGQTYHVALDLPGVDPDSVEVQLERNTLTVSAERDPEYGSAIRADQSGGAQQRQVLVAERPQGSFTRQLALGEGLDVAGVQADYRNGVLYLTIPVAQQAKPRRIQVGVSSSGGRPHLTDDSSEQRDESSAVRSGSGAQPEGSADESGSSSPGTP